MNLSTTMPRRGFPLLPTHHVCARARRKQGTAYTGHVPSTPVRSHLTFPQRFVITHLSTSAGGIKKKTHALLRTYIPHETRGWQPNKQKNKKSARRHLPLRIKKNKYYVYNAAKKNIDQPKIGTDHTSSPSLAGQSPSTTTSRIYVSKETTSYCLLSLTCHTQPDRQTKTDRKTPDKEGSSFLRLIPSHLVSCRLKPARFCSIYTAPATSRLLPRTDARGPYGVGTSCTPPLPATLHTQTPNPGDQARFSSLYPLVSNGGGSYRSSHHRFARSSHFALLPIGSPCNALVHGTPARTGGTKTPYARALRVTPRVPRRRAASGGGGCHPPSGYMIRGNPKATFKMRRRRRAVVI